MAAAPVGSLICFPSCVSMQSHSNLLRCRIDLMSAQPKARSDEFEQFSSRYARSLSCPALSASRAGKAVELAQTAFTCPRPHASRPGPATERFDTAGEDVLSLVWRFRSPHVYFREFVSGLLNQSHTRTNKLLVSLRFRSSQTRVPHNPANFGIGTLGRRQARIHRAQARAHDVHHPQRKHGGLLNHVQEALLVNGDHDRVACRFGCRAPRVFADQSHFAENAAGSNRFEYVIAVDNLHLT